MDWVPGKIPRLKKQNGGEKISRPRPYLRLQDSAVDYYGLTLQGYSLKKNALA